MATRISAPPRVQNNLWRSNGDHIECIFVIDFSVRVQNHRIRRSFLKLHNKSFVAQLLCHFNPEICFCCNKKRPNIFTPRSKGEIMQDKQKIHAQVR